MSNCITLCYLSRPNFGHMDRNRPLRVFKIALCFLIRPWSFFNGQIVLRSWYQHVKTGSLNVTRNHYQLNAATVLHGTSLLVHFLRISVFLFSCTWEWSARLDKSPGFQAKDYIVLLVHQNIKITVLGKVRVQRVDDIRGVLHGHQMRSSRDFDTVSVHLLGIRPNCRSLSSLCACAFSGTGEHVASLSEMNLHRFYISDSNYVWRSTVLRLTYTASKSCPMSTYVSFWWVQILYFHVTHSDLFMVSCCYYLNV